MARQRRVKGTGTVRQLPSRRWQAIHTGPDGVKRSAPHTFDSKGDGEAWLKRQGRLVDSGTWEAPDKREAGTLRGYTEGWLAGRDLKPRTSSEYRRLLDRLVLPDLGDLRLEDISPTAVRSWYGRLNPKRPTQRARAYQVLRTVLQTATTDGLIPSNPCRITGTTPRPRHQTRPVSLPELETIAAAMPARYRAMVLMAMWTGLRYGELTELRRKDIDIKRANVRVARAVTHVDGEFVVSTPKSAAGSRDVRMPPHLVPIVEAHLGEHVEAERDALLFPGVGGGHLATATFYRHWYAARHLADRDDLRFHDLRHSHATLAAQTGATIRELMARLGHSTPGAAMRYQHAASEADARIAAKLSALVTESDGT